MPTLRIETKRLTLPSTADAPNELDRYWVDVKVKLSTRDHLTVTEGEGTDRESINKRALRNINLYIVDWNCNDEQGEKLEINPANIGKLDFDDFTFIAKNFAETLDGAEEGLPTDEKKESSATSIPVIEASPQA